jgi:hypothetical protein
VNTAMNSQVSLKNVKCFDLPVSHNILLKFHNVICLKYLNLTLHLMNGTFG